MRALAQLSRLPIAVMFAGVLGCAGTVSVRPHPPVGSFHGDRSGRVSLHLDPAMRSSRVVSRSPTGDVGLGDVTVDFDLGESLARTIESSAGAVFAAVEPVDAPVCGSGSNALLLVSLAAPPYAQVHWRDQTPRVGGGTIAEIIVRVVYQDCSGGEVARAVAYGFGDEENMQSGANWPNEADFSLGIERALANLSLNLVDLFADIAAALRVS